MATDRAPWVAAFAWVNLAVAFLVEILALCALGYAAAGATHQPLGRVALALGVPVAAAIAWGVFAAPRAPVRITWLARSVKTVVFVGAAAGVAVRGHPVLGLAFLIVVALNLALVRLLPPVDLRTAGPS